MQMEWKGLTRKDAPPCSFGKPQLAISAPIGNIKRWRRCHCVSDLPSRNNMGAVVKAFQRGTGPARERLPQSICGLNRIEGLPRASLKELMGMAMVSNHIQESGERATGQPRAE
jgi:hypothetical protein